jgi:5S rRNA maturation endonuclease (ribonuclease M5)
MNMIQSIFNVKDFLVSIGYKIHGETSSHYRMKPIYRSSNNDSVLSVDKKTGWFTDFKTGDSGPLYKLVSITKNISIYEAKLLVGDTASKKDEEEPKMQIDIPLTFNKEEIKELLPSYYFYNKRGISTETLKYFQSGYCTYGKMSDRYVFPIFHKSGELRGLAGRDVTNKKIAKWKNLGHTKGWDYPYFFNKEYIKEANEIILVESIGDMLALWECGIRNVLVAFGTKIAQETLLTIISSNPSRVIISMNFDLPDETGFCPGQEAAKKIEKKLAVWFNTNKICTSFPNGNDFGSMSKDEILQWKEKL